MNLDQNNLTSYNQLKKNHEAATANDADQVDVARQFGDRIDLTFPDLWATKGVRCAKDLVEAVGQDVACALLSDAIGAKVDYDDWEKFFSWDKIEGVRYQPDRITYRMEDSYPLHYDESGHLITPLRWYNGTDVALTCGLDLTHGYRSDFAFVRASMERGMRNGHAVVTLAKNPGEATHLMVRSAWGGAHSTTRGLLGETSKKSVTDERLLFSRRQMSNNGGEGVDYFCIALTPEDPDRTALHTAILYAFTNGAAAQMRVEDEFWKRHLRITALHNSYNFLEKAYTSMQRSVDHCLVLLRNGVYDHDAGLIKKPLLHVPDHAGMPELEELKSDEEYYAYSAKELDELAQQLEKQHEEMLSYATKFEIITRNWLDYAEEFRKLNEYLSDGWVEVFGEAAVVTFPVQKESFVTLPPMTSKLGATECQQTVFPLSAGALAAAAKLVQEHLKEIDAQANLAKRVLDELRHDAETKGKTHDDN